MLLFSCAYKPAIERKIASASCSCNGQSDDTNCLRDLFLNNQQVELANDQVCTSTRPLTLGNGASVRGQGATIRFALTEGSTAFNITGSDVLLSDLNVIYKPNGPRQANAVIRLSENVSRVRISNNHIQASGSYQGILSEKARNTQITISGNTIENTTYGILVNAHHLGPDPAEYQSGWVIEKNRIVKNNGDAIEINSPIGKKRTPAMSMRDFRIVDNELEAAGGKTAGAGFCLGVAGLHNAVIAGNIMSRCKWQCIHIEDHSGNILVQNNQCLGTIGPKPNDKTRWAANDSSGIILLGTVHDIRVLDNELSDTAGFGIELTGSSRERAYTSNIVVAGNKITRAGTHAIFVGGDAGVRLDSLVGPSHGFPGNTTVDSGKPQGSLPAGQGSILQNGGENVIIQDNSGN